MKRSILLLVLFGCGGDDSPPLDGGPSADTGPADAPSDGPTPPPAGDRLGVFGPAPSFFELFVDESGSTTDAFHFGAYRTGFTWPIPFAGDLDGDGFDSVGFYDPRARAFHLRVEEEEVVVVFGDAPGVPLVGDWDGDGDDELGVYDPATGRASLADDAFAAARSVDGPSDRLAFAADLDGDGVDDIVYYTGTSFEILEPETRTITLDGAPANAYPFAIDGDGDGVDGIGVFDLASQDFHLYASVDAAPTTVELRDVNWVRLPVVGRWRATSARPADTGHPFDEIDPAAVGIDDAWLREATRAFAAMPNLRSFLLLRDGALAHESYFHGNRPEIAHNIKSVSKSILATVLASAVDDGTVRDLPIVSLLPAALDDGDPRRARITLGDLLTMRAGLAWNEDAIGDWFAGDDWVSAAFSAAMTTEPGAVFNYSTGNTHLASAIVSRETDVATDAFARARLLAPLGIDAERWDRDPDGTPVGGAEVTMRPRDLARFGQLFLEDGAPDGVRLVDETVIDSIRTEWVEPSAIDGSLGYGAWWWTRSFGGADAYFAWGYGGQFVFVFDALNAVVVVTSRSDVDGATSTGVSNSVFSVITDHVVPALGG